MGQLRAVLVEKYGHKQLWLFKSLLEQFSG